MLNNYLAYIKTIIKQFYFKQVLMNSINLPNRYHHKHTLPQ